MSQHMPVLGLLGLKGMEYKTGTLYFQMHLCLNTLDTAVLPNIDMSSL